MRKVRSIVRPKILSCITDDEIVAVATGVIERWVNTVNGQTAAQPALSTPVNNASDPGDIHFLRNGAAKTKHIQ